MTSDTKLRLDNDAAQLLASSNRDDVVVAIFGPITADPDDVTRAADRALQATRNELAYHEQRVEKESESEEGPEPATKYGHLVDSEPTLATEGGDTDREFLEGSA